VSAAAALADAVWFERRPHRRFRLRHGDRGWWLVRKQGGGVFLRTWTPQAIGPLDDDKQLATSWYAIAWPGELVTKSMKRGRKAAGAAR
jgi:hypothetical protein